MLILLIVILFLVVYMIVRQLEMNTEEKENQ